MAFDNLMSLLFNLPQTFDNALATCQVLSDPFRVFYFKPFADDLYAAILDHLPEDRFYQPMMHRDAMRPDGSSTRLIFALKSERIDLLPYAQKMFWRELADELKGDDVRAVFQKHLKADLELRPDAPTLYPALILLRDLSGYKITPHPDTPSKVVTCQFYLPEDTKQSALGTSFYKRLDDGAMHKVCTLGFYPNSAYCFTVTDHSFHGTEFGEFAGAPRNTMMLNYYKLAFDKY